MPSHSSSADNVQGGVRNDGENIHRFCSNCIGVAMRIKNVNKDAALFVEYGNKLVDDVPIESRS